MPFQKFLKDNFQVHVTIFLCLIAALYIIVISIFNSRIDEYYYEKSEVNLQNHQDISDEFLFEENMTLEIVDEFLDVIEARGTTQSIKGHYTPSEFATLLATSEYELDVFYETIIDEAGHEFTVILKQYITVNELKTIRNYLTIQMMLIVVGTIIIAMMIFNHFLDSINSSMEHDFMTLKENLFKENDFIDTDEIKIAEITDLAIRYNQERQASQSLLTQNHRLVSSLSHDLKSPITSILGYSNLLTEYEDSSNNDYLTYIKQGANELEVLSNLLFDQIKYQNHTFELNKEVLNINDLLQDVCAERYINFEKKDFEVTFKIEQNDRQLSIDSTHFKRCLINIMNNCVAHNPHGTTVEIKSFENKMNYCIDIKNNGEPIPLDNRATIFEAFYTSDVSRNHHSGLGLFISRKIIEKHGGTLELVEDNDYNTCFRISLPI